MFRVFVVQYGLGGVGHWWSETDFIAIAFSGYFPGSHLFYFFEGHSAFRAPIKCPADYTSFQDLARFGSTGTLRDVVPICLLRHLS